MLGHLITAEGTRSERGEEELLGASPEARPALRALVEGRLLHARTVGGRATYEIAHEALIASWDTLRHWLDEDAGQRALRQRIEAASAEWERLGRTEELLWRKRQLSESRAVEATSLGAREQDFLRTSQRAVRRQRLRLGLAAGLIVLGVAALTGGPLLRESLETQRFLSERMAAAEAALAKGRELARHASETRRKALLLFDGQDPEASQGTQASHHFWPQAQETWAEALEALRQADTAHSEAGRALDDMFERVIDHAAARELRIALTYERILLAEEFHRKEERARFVQDFERLTARDRAWRERLEAPAGLEIKTTPPGARVELWWYEEVNGVRRRVPVSKLGALGTTPLARVSLQAGSYHLRFTREGHAPVDLPLLLERGKTESVDLVLPSSVPEGTVYIPPGCSLLGSADPEEVREFMHSAPLHPRCLSQGYFIGRTEVTVGEWLEYLESPAATEAERHLLATPRPSTAGALSLEPLPGGGWRFTLHPSGGPEVSARDGELLRYPGRRHRSAQDWRRFPLAGVSVDELAGFLAWLDRSGRLPGARLCSETEWTRAARGADDRRHPHGNRLQKDDANIDVTYDRQLNAFGPDEVGSHPASESPFGLQDLAGNAFEITQAPIPDLGDYVILGGAWYFERIGTFITNRQAFTSSARDVTVGVRLCASWRAPPPP
jgi:formylglycine-generating enzyme required for sulfatase activity